MSLSQRAMTSAAWNVGANITQVIVLAVRMIILARLLPVDLFGVYAFAGSMVVLTGELASFGMGGAFLHRSPETEDEEQAAALHFTLKCIFTAVWVGLLAGGALLFTSGQTRYTILVLTAITAGMELTQTPQLILTRRVVQRRMAIIQILTVLSTTAVALTLAWRGITLWALLATDLVTLVLTVLLLYVWRPVWRPRFAWSRSATRYFLRFGSRNFMSAVLSRALDRVDDLWTGIFLGQTALGLYSRAYTFATYPRRVLAGPIGDVAIGTYAELKGDRRRLSQAFFRTNALLVRSGFLLAGLLALIAPEFIRLVIGEKWMPMLDAFRLMLVFTLFDPIKGTVANLFVAVGKPEQVMQARFVQLVVLAIGLAILGPRWDIAGVALAVDLMLVVGIALLLWRARPYVDYSIPRLFVPPAIALAASLLGTWGALAIPGIRGSDWRTGAVKIAVFSIIYTTLLLVLERDRLGMLLDMVKQLRPARPSARQELDTSLNAGVPLASIPGEPGTRRANRRQG